MIENLVNMQNVQYTKEMAKNIFDKNPKFKEMVQETIFDNDIDFINDEFLSKIPSVEFTINSIYTTWYDFNPECYYTHDAINIASEIVENDWDTFEVYDGEISILSDDYIKMMEKLRERVCFKVPEFSKAYDLLDSRLAKMVNNFLYAIQGQIDSIINSCYNDEDYVIDQFTEYSECFKLDNYYLNEDTLDVYKIEHA